MSQPLLIAFVVFAVVTGIHGRMMPQRAMRDEGFP
jgi:hypothetical protein